MSQAITCTFFRDSHERHGRRVTTTWTALAARMLRHDVGTKDGPAITCGTFRGRRSNATLVARSMVALDIETSPRTGEVPIPFDAMAAHLTGRRVRAVMWTTHSHTADAPRYRILMPLNVPLEYEPGVDPFLTAACAAQLGCHGVSDPSKFGLASLFYLPRHPAGASWQAQEIAGDPIDVGYLLTMATTMAERVAQDEAEIAARRRANALPPELLSIITEYNERNVIAEKLMQYGYRRDGVRYKSRYQHGIGATSILPDGKVWTSFSQSDADAGLGSKPQRPSSQCACWGDAFALFVHFEHAGNFRRALSALQGDGNA
jgi:hypothetical protein